MSMIHDVMLDAALNAMISAGSRLDLCSSEPGTYAAVAGVSLANKTSIEYGAIADRVGGGREVQVNAISGGSCTANGTATHFAITNGTSVLYVTGALNASVQTASGASFTLTAFKVAIPDPA